MNRSLFPRICIVVACSTAAIFGSAAASAAPSQKAVEMIGAVRPAIAAELPKHARADSGVSGVINAAAISAATVSLTLADGRKITAELQRVVRDDQKKTQSWIGAFTDSPGSVLVLTKAAGAISGFANYGSETLEILPGKSGRHVLYGVDTARLPDMHPSSASNGYTSGDTAGTTSDYGLGGTTLTAGDAVVHDVLVVYTAAAAGAWGASTLQSMIQSAVQSANQAYQNSLVSINLSMVGLQQVVLTESTSMGATMTALTQNTEVRSLRDKYAADMVILVSQNSDGCGQASLSGTASGSMVIWEAYAIVYSSCLSQQTLAHEVGHLQRVDHNRDNKTGIGMYEYSYGYRICDATGFRDIMSYPCSGLPRILNFSNPNVSYNGYPTGISYEADPANSADGARTLNNTATMVAGYRVATSATGGTTTVPASPSGLAASSVAFDKVSLAWVDNATNESGYKVERSKDGVTFAEIASLGADARSFADAAVSTSTNYFYRVRAFNSAGFSGYSNTVGVTTPAAPPPPPPAPTSVSAANRGDGSALVAWASDATTATSFEVTRETWDSRKQVWGRSTLAATVPASVLSIIDATSNGTFRYFVRATNAGGASGNAGPAQVSVSGGKRTGKR